MPIVNNTWGESWADAWADSWGIFGAADDGGIGAILVALKRRRKRKPEQVNPYAEQEVEAGDGQEE